MLAARMQAATAGVPAPGGNPEQRLFASQPTPASPNISDGGTHVALGIMFRPAVAGQIKGAHIHFSTTPPGSPVTLVLYEVGVGVVHSESLAVAGGGWRRLDFASPPAVDAATDYQIYYHQTAVTGTVRYAATTSYPAFSGGETIGDLYILSSAESPAGQGQFLYDNANANTPPGSAFNDGNYWIDPIFVAD